MKYRILLLLICVAICAPASAQLLSGRVEVAIVDADKLPTWQSNGTGILRPENEGFQSQQAFIRTHFDLNSHWSVDAVLNAYEDGVEHLGFTQAFLRYKPLMPNKIKVKARLGFFYPSMSIENVAEGWLSPYTYTQSAINSWIGEELRNVGGELSVFENGRASRSPWSWEATLGAFKGNDPLGSLLTWRGFAMHDRQSLHSDRVNFARLPSVINENAINSPAWVEPFTEIDGRWGAYIGFHLRHFRTTEARYYFYDNRADPSVINQARLYAWHTKFHSLALQHNFDSQWRLMFQIMDGATDMGPNIVRADFTAWYLAGRYSFNKHSVTLRYDWFDVREDDSMPEDQNSSNGYGITLAWRYQYDRHWEFGAEYHRNENRADNRVQLGIPLSQTQVQSRLVVAYRF
ncbi:hypothetical protein [Alteromonas sp.]|uniref:hypothetical protein n=1 Tax=Alteromonas sp. TaxID=232 RepID=UPI000B6CBB8E|nr:hypothetical protein [Alteromonas sp.]MAI37043.1 hypothetical protein [Alteromonas sp.]OUX89671.1 MAG: hypothetical protein CBB95_05655 [Alteromonas sp. TMED35]